jgi:hypothetical protein
MDGMTTAEWSFRQDREAGRENRRSFRCAALPLVRTDAASRERAIISSKGDATS